MPQGGWQGGRGWQINGTSGAIYPNPSFYVENIREELDAPNEWFFDAKASKLYLVLNDTSANSGGPPTETYIASQHKELIGIRGSMSQPIQDITIRGIGFRDSAKTFMEPWGVPSGGDWALYRGGAIFVEGAENITVEKNLFKRVDGNGVFLSGYTRDVVIDANEFVWIGDCAMAGWGYTTMDGDGTAGEQPRRTTISNNVAHELGVFQLQSSMWFQAKCAETTITNNIFYNGPRAGINFNDGFGGKNVVEKNLIFNQCRHSGDHGPMNSWDRQVGACTHTTLCIHLSRCALTASLSLPSSPPPPLCLFTQPFLTDVPHGADKPTYYTALSDIKQNFIIANYGGSQGFDNDDGSTRYNITSNFIYGEGLKQDYGGHDSLYEGNVNIVHHYDNQQCFNTWPFNPPHQHTFKNNTCVILYTWQVGSAGACSAGNPKQGICANALVDGKFAGKQCMLDLSANAYYTPFGNATVSCGRSDVLLKDLQKGGVDPGSTSAGLPSNDQIIAWGRAVLGMAS